MTCNWPDCDRPGATQVGYVASSDSIPRIADLCTWHRNELRLMIASQRTVEVEELFETLSREAEATDRPVPLTKA